MKGYQISTMDAISWGTRILSLFAPKLKTEGPGLDSSRWVVDGNARDGLRSEVSRQSLANPPASIFVLGNFHNS